MLKPLQSALLSSSHLHIKHGFFTRQGGCSTNVLSSLNMRPSSFEQVGNFDVNCQRVCSWFDCDLSKLILMQQVHSDHVVWIEAKTQLNPIVADAMLTQQSNLILGVRTADCVPVLLYDPKTSICGVVHVGWRGALLNILAKTLNMMCERGSLISDVYAALGPCIQVQSFEVDAKIRQIFLDVDVRYQSFFTPGVDPQHVWFDLLNLALFQLESQGVTKCDSLNIDTYQDSDRFFSYRRSQHAQEKTYGNQISAITLR